LSECESKGPGILISVSIAVGMGSTGRGSISPIPRFSIESSLHRERSSLRAKSTVDGRRRRRKDPKRRNLGAQWANGLALRLRAPDGDDSMFLPPGLEFGEHERLLVVDDIEPFILCSWDCIANVVRRERRKFPSWNGDACAQGYSRSILGKS